MPPKRARKSNASTPAPASDEPVRVTRATRSRLAQASSSQASSSQASQPQPPQASSSQAQPRARFKVSPIPSPAHPPPASPAPPPSATSQAPATTPLPQLPAERLNFADAPRPFKAKAFASKLPQRTASAATTGFKRTVKQILTLERERVGGGDGFLSAAQTAAKARGEPIEPAKKKKKENPVGKKKVPRRSGVSTPMTVDDESVMSGTATPFDDDEEGGTVEAVEGGKEVITYHTPTAPPSLLPAKKYCDITGLHAAYTDPRTKLRYKGLEVWSIVRNLGPGVDQSYLSLRGAQTSLK